MCNAYNNDYCFLCLPLFLCLKRSISTPGGDEVKTTLPAPEKWGFEPRSLQKPLSPHLGEADTIDCRESSSPTEDCVREL